MTKESLYEISFELDRLMFDIEDSGGEITPEQEQALEIAQDKLNEKVQDYTNAIKTWKANVKSCKEEKKKFDDKAKMWENRVDRASKALLNAINSFGYQGKTNKFIELPTVRVSTRNTQAIEVDEQRIDTFIMYFESFIREMYNNDILEEVDVDGLIDVINANAIAENGENFKPYTYDDLSNIMLEINSKMGIHEFFGKGIDILKGYCANSVVSDIKNITPKDDWKSAIDFDKEITFASKVHNQSLIIK